MRLFLTIALLMAVGCANAPKKEVLAGSVPGAIAVGKGISRFFPGHRTRKLNRLDFRIEVKEKELRLEELRAETKRSHLEYKKLFLVGDN